MSRTVAPCNPIYRVARITFKAARRDQARGITSGADDDPASARFVKYAKDIANELRSQIVRLSTDFSNHPSQVKIQDAELADKIPPPQVGGSGSSAAVATWTPARGASVPSAKARRQRSRRRKSWRKSWRR